MIPSALLISSVQDRHGQARLTVDGDIDRDAVNKLRHHLQALVRAQARFIVVDLTAAPACDAQLLAGLSSTQRRLTSRRGMISVVGSVATPCSVMRRFPTRFVIGRTAALT